MDSNNQPPRGFGLPLTEGASSPGPDHQAGVHATEADIRRLVVTFYDGARVDPLLGPIFEREVGDWDAHYDRLVDFWSSAVLKTGRYSGRPGAKHFGLGLTPDHFARWLALWERTANDLLGEAKAAPFVDMGRRMGRGMMNITGMLA